MRVVFGLVALLAGISAMAAPSPSPHPLALASVRPRPSARPSPRAQPSVRPSPATHIKPSPRPSVVPSVTPRPSPSAAPKAKKGELPPLLREVEATYGKSPTLAANFSQVSQSAVGGPKRSSGTVEFKRPNKFRWQVTQPDQSTSVCNGSKFWHYTPPFDEEDHGQVIIKPASAVQTKVANALLSGSFSTIRDMKITPAGTNSFTLVPKRGSAGTVRKARIEINPESKLIYKVQLDHAGGNHAVITLSNIQLGKPLGDDHFNFKVPPNTDQADP